MTAEQRRLLVCFALVIIVLMVPVAGTLLQNLQNMRGSTVSISLPSAGQTVSRTLDVEAPGEFVNAQGQLLLAQRNIPKEVPELAPGLAPAPGHVQNHPDGAIRQAAWNTAMNAWFNGRPPNKCWKWGDASGQPVSSGPTLAQFDIQLPLVDDGVTSGILLILQPESNWSRSTAIPRGTRTNGMKVDFSVEVPCPPGPPSMALAP